MLTGCLRSLSEVLKVLSLELLWLLIVGLLKENEELVGKTKHYIQVYGNNI
jgi:hypothetical protein